MMSEWNVELRKTFCPVSKRYQNWQRHFTAKRISSKMTFPNNDNRWKGIVEKSWQDTPTQFCVCKDSKNIYFVKAPDYQFLLFSFLAFSLSNIPIDGLAADVEEFTIHISFFKQMSLTQCCFIDWKCWWNEILRDITFITFCLYLLLSKIVRGITGMDSSVSSQSVSHDSHVDVDCHDAEWGLRRIWHFEWLIRFVGNQGK